MTTCRRRRKPSAAKTKTTSKTKGVRKKKGEGVHLWTLAEALAQVPDVAPPPLVVSYGAGWDSTAMLIGMWRRGIRPDLILFADTGGEKPETYAYIPIMNAWLRSVGFPEIVIVRKGITHGKLGAYSTLEEKCLVLHTFPSIAFGFQRRDCSQTWKHGPMDAYVKTWAPAVAASERGVRVIRLIGYDAGPKDARRCWDLTEDKHFVYVYLLREWGWDRERCGQEILSAGLPLPPKSACFFCPASQPEEIARLDLDHPELTARIEHMEAVAAPYNRVAKGLWFADKKNRPGSMTAFLEQVREERAQKRRLPLLQGVA